MSVGASLDERGHNFGKSDFHRAWLGLGKNCYSHEQEIFGADIFSERWSIKGLQLNGHNHLLISAVETDFMYAYTQHMG